MLSNPNITMIIRFCESADSMPRMNWLDGIRVELDPPISSPTLHCVTLIVNHRMARVTKQAASLVQQYRQWYHFGRQTLSLVRPRTWPSRSSRESSWSVACVRQWCRQWYHLGRQWCRCLPALWYRQWYHKKAVPTVVQLW